MGHKIFFYWIILAWLSVSPAKVGNSSPIDIICPTVNYDTAVPSQEIKRLEAIKKQKIEELASLAKKQKVIYRTKEVKPKKIILYVRDSAGIITEHEIQSDGGFYIIDAAKLKPDSNGTEIQIQEDTVAQKNTIWQRIFK